MNYFAALDYISSFIDFEKIPRYNYTSNFRLERMYAFMKELGHPHQGLNVLHVAGSKGKGSTCAIIASILKQAGYRAGLYTSPHLLDTRERIRVLDRHSLFVVRDSEGFEGTIGRKEFIGLIDKIRPVAEKFRDHEELGKLSFFEILTACAFLHFKEKNVDIAILETGLGGRLDATNVTMPLVCGIANISLEHTDKLGNSLGEIAREKTGIIKEQGLVVSAPQEHEVGDVIREVCREKNANLYEIGKDVKYSIVKSDESGQIFNLDGPGYSYKNLHLKLLGAHQVENAALAIAMVMEDITEDIIQAGLKDVFWPGRLQLIQKKPYLILDGAQNVASIRKVLSSIKAIFHYNRLISVFGISGDKDIEGMVRELDNAGNIVILTRSKSERAKEPPCLKKNFSRAEVRLTNNVEEALEQGMEVASKEDLVLVTGSLYVVGEALANQHYEYYKTR